jgi:hypothetical protein
LGQDIAQANQDTRIGKLDISGESGEQSMLRGARHRPVHTVRIHLYHSQSLLFC